MRYKSRKQMIKYCYCLKWINTVWKQFEREVKNEQIPDN